MHLYIEIASWSTRLPRLPFTSQTNTITSIHPGRDLHIQRLGLLIAPFTMTLAARILDDLALAPAMRTGLADRKETLSHLHLASTVTGWAGLGLTARFGARAMTLIATHQGRDLDLLADTAHGLLKGQLHVVTQIGAPRRTLLATATTEDIAEDITKDIPEIGTTTKTARTSPHAGINPGMAILVIGCPLLGVSQDLVSFLDFLELLFRLRILAVAVGMVFHGQTLVSLLDLAIIGRALDTQYFI